MGLFSGEKITLTLQKYDYHPGEKITGVVNLKLKKPTKARKLEVEFIGKQIDTSTGMGIGPTAHKGAGKQARVIYRFNMPLSGEQEYLEGTYPFEIKIPENILQGTQSLEGKVGTAITALKAISGVYSRVEWYVEAQLDVPMSIDIRKTQKIILS